MTIVRCAQRVHLPRTPDEEQQERFKELKELHPVQQEFFDRDFVDELDHIFYSSKSLRPLGVLGQIDQDYLRRVPGFPNQHFPSDHLALVAEFKVEKHRNAQKVEADLAVLLTYQYDSGNWPSSLPPERDRLVQVCHGAPGIVISLLSIKQYFPNLEEKIDKAIAKGRQCILERGLCTKDPCICHGKSSLWLLVIH